MSSRETIRILALQSIARGQTRGIGMSDFCVSELFLSSPQCIRAGWKPSWRPVSRWGLKMMFRAVEARLDSGNSTLFASRPAEPLHRQGTLSLSMENDFLDQHAHLRF